MQSLAIADFAPTPTVARHCLKLDGGAACPDCPAGLRGQLGSMIPDATHGCSFQQQVLEARENVPLKWFGEHSFALVRRGILVRQRSDARGRTSAVDVVGPGCGFPLDQAPLPCSSGYAVTRSLVCLTSSTKVEKMLRAGGQDAVDWESTWRATVDRMERLTDARARSTLESRVCALLCVLADVLIPQEADLVPSGLYQRDLAALLSVRHESVCRVVRKLSKRGLIELTDDGTRLLQRAELEAI